MEEVVHKIDSRYMYGLISHPSHLECLYCSREPVEPKPKKARAAKKPAPD